MGSDAGGQAILSLYLRNLRGFNIGITNGRDLYCDRLGLF
jgi:hypothetical protein